MSAYLPPPPPTLVIEAPAIAEARDQCSHADWAYIGSALGTFAAATTADVVYFKYADAYAARATGPALMGLSWGWLMSAAVWARPLCDDGLRLPPAPEGSQRDLPEFRWLGPLLGLMTAPIIVAIAEGRVPPEWPFQERWIRLTGASLAGLAGSFSYELWNPAPLRGIRTLDKASLSFTGTSATFTLRF
jgi:hypothetical protein